MAWSVNRVRRGVEHAPVETIALRAGNLSVKLVGPDLRAVRWGGTEVIQRLYMAVRDAPWNTIPGQLLDQEITQAADYFIVVFRQRHAFQDIELEWKGEIRGSDDGVLTYDMDARASRSFRHSKIGLNIHHGLETYRGRRFKAVTGAGNLEATLPSDIEPQLVRDGSLTAMFDHFDQITFDLDGVQAEFSFEGDLFEMQDHRNWSDANYKTYGTPLSFGFPRDVAQGECIWQRVTLRLTGAASSTPSEDAILLTPAVGAQALPKIGHRLVDDSPPAERVLSLARPDHLRVEIGPAEDVAARLATVRSLTRAREAPNPTPLELVLFLDLDAPGGATDRLAAALLDGSDDIARVVVLGAAGAFSEFKGATPAGAVEATQAVLRSRGIDTPVFSGTDQFFNELNRARPDYSNLEGINFSLNPQVHACDDRSLTDNARTVGDISAFCRRLYPSAEISIGPVHLVGPEGPFPAGPPTADGPPAGLDPRQTSLFGAAWTVAFVEAAARSAVEHITLFDLVGPRGLAEVASPGEAMQGFPSEAGRPYPLLWALSQLRTDAKSEAVLVDGTDSRCAAIGVPTPSGLRLIVANLQAEVADVRIQHDGPAATVLVLDELSAQDTDIFSGDGPPEAQLPAVGGWLPLLLRPFAVACVELPSTSET